MKRICSEVEEATEEVIRQTRAESEARIAELESKIAELQEDVKDAKRSAKYDLDDMARANRSLRRELEEANEEMSRMYSELEAKTDEFDALNEDVERFAETFAAQHEEVRQLERQVRRLQEENTNLKLLDDANRKRIVELQNESKGKADSVSTPDDQGRMMWRELAKMRKEIANMQQNKLMSPSGSVQNANNQTRRGTCSDLSSDDEDEECEDEL
jgi:chromosome segregation ATPase